MSTAIERFKLQITAAEEVLKEFKEAKAAGSPTYILTEIYGRYLTLVTTIDYGALLGELPDDGEDQAS